MRALLTLFDYVLGVYLIGWSIGHGSLLVGLIGGIILTTAVNRTLPYFEIERRDRWSQP